MREIWKKCCYLPEKALVWKEMRAPLPPSNDFLFMILAKKDQLSTSDCLYTNKNPGASTWIECMLVKVWRSMLMIHRSLCRYCKMEEMRFLRMTYQLESTQRVKVGYKTVWGVMLMNDSESTYLMLGGRETFGANWVDCCVDTIQYVDWMMRRISDLTPCSIIVFKRVSFHLKSQYRKERRKQKGKHYREGQRKHIKYIRYWMI